MASTKTKTNFEDAEQALKEIGNIRLNPNFGFANATGEKLKSLQERIISLIEKCFENATFSSQLNRLNDLAFSCRVSLADANIDQADFDIKLKKFKTKEKAAETRAKKAAEKAGLRAKRLSEEELEMKEIVNNTQSFSAEQCNMNKPDKAGSSWLQKIRSIKIPKIPDIETTPQRTIYGIIISAILIFIVFLYKINWLDMFAYFTAMALVSSLVVLSVCYGIFRLVKLFVNKKKGLTEEKTEKQNNDVSNVSKLDTIKSRFFDTLANVKSYWQKPKENQSDKADNSRWQKVLGMAKKINPKYIFNGLVILATGKVLFLGITNYNVIYTETMELQWYYICLIVLAVCGAIFGSYKLVSFINKKFFQKKPVDFKDLKINSSEDNSQSTNDKGFDKNGYDANGYDANGYDVNGIDAEGYDIYGIKVDNSKKSLEQATKSNVEITETAEAEESVEEQFFDTDTKQEPIIEELPEDDTPIEPPISMESIAQKVPTEVQATAGDFIGKAKTATVTHRLKFTNDEEIAAFDALSSREQAVFEILKLDINPENRFLILKGFNLILETKPDDIETLMEELTEIVAQINGNIADEKEQLKFFQIFTESAIKDAINASINTNRKPFVNILGGKVIEKMTFNNIMKTRYNEHYQLR